MSRIKLLLDVVNGMRSLADSLEIMANAMADGDSISKEKVLAQKAADTPSVIRNWMRPTRTNSSVSLRLSCPVRENARKSSSLLKNTV